MADASTCAFYTASLSFTAPINARHYCLLGDNRYTAPTATGVCQVLNGGTGSICDTCLSLNEANATQRPCSFHKGIGGQTPELAIPPLAGYDDVQCPIGYDQYTGVLSMELHCPRDSVLLLELFPMGHYYDFSVSTDHKITRQWESQQCLTGQGGVQCGDKPLKFFAYHQDGHCELGFRQGYGLQARCGALSALASSNFMADSALRKKMDCHIHNDFSCSTVTARYNQLRNINQTATSASSSGSHPGTAATATDTTNSNSSAIGKSFSGGQDFCHLNSGSAFFNPLAWVAGIITMSITLAPGLTVWYRQTYSVTPTFMVGLLSEALKNAMITITAISTDWECLTSKDHGLMVAPTDDHTIFLPYAYLAFSMAEVALSIIAVVSNWGMDQLEDSFDKFKWVKFHENLIRRGCTFVTIVVFGGIAGFMQLALIMEGTVDSSVHHDNGKGISTWASWTFVVSATLGAFIGGVMIILGVFNKVKLSSAWKLYKFLVGDIPGLVSAGELAAILVPGWTFEMFNDLLHLALYIPSYAHERKRKFSRARTMS